MRVGASLVLIAVGAILKWAVSASVSGVDLGMIGVILMVVGVVGLVISLVLMTTRRRTDVVQEGAPYVDGYGRTVAPRRRTTYVEPAERDPLL